MKHKVVRTFHPVGQGAFYTERHVVDDENTYNIVYDCGCSNNLTLASHVVKQTSSEMVNVDILFISHFDYDHVSLLDVLIENVQSVSCVVLPLLSAQEQEYMRAYCLSVRNKGDERRTMMLRELIASPREYIKRWFVSKNVKAPIVVEMSNRVSEETLKEMQDSCHVITAYNDGVLSMMLNDNGIDWGIKTYNVHSEERGCALRRELNANNITRENLNDVNWILSNRKKLRRIYEKLDGTVNDNSLLLYSGPVNVAPNNNWQKCTYVYRCEVGVEVLSNSCPGCVYTGDVDLKQVNLNDVFTAEMQYVGTIQIPHHGSRYSFDFDSAYLNKPGMICPVSHGVVNRYCHPHDEVKDYFRKSQSVMLNVTEKLNSTVYENCLLVN